MPGATSGIVLSAFEKDYYLFRPKRILASILKGSAKEQRYAIEE
jgi:hypothetical protein